MQLKSVQWFLTRRFLSFLYQYIGKISPTPCRPCFLTNHVDLNSRGSPNYIEICAVDSDKKIFEVFFFLWLPWQPEFCTDFKSLNNFQPVSPKDQSSKNLLNWLSGLGGDVVIVDEQTDYDNNCNGG